MNLLITGAWSGAREKIEKIENMGHNVVFLQFEKDDLPCCYEWVEGVICNSLFQNHAIEKFSNLHYIQLTSAGFDRVPMDFVKARGIKICNAGGVYSIPMAEYAISSVLHFYKQSFFFYENQKQHSWRKNRELLELYGKIVCIVGCGSVGTECAKRFQAFGCSVIGIATQERVSPYFDKICSVQELDKVFINSDVIVLAIPLTEETWHLINEKNINQMKPGVILVNISRGGIIDTKALIGALKKQQIYGAVLDVFEEEPLDIENELWELKNVYISPHNSFIGENNQKRLWKCIRENIIRWGTD